MPEVPARVKELLVIVQNLQNAHHACSSKSLKRCNQEELQNAQQKLTSLAYWRAQLLNFDLSVDGLQDLIQ
ncbi:hypothetical protein DC3_43490 [Deinococcus cellulosilyticus NBRC 106333 = KACC 11606]|uniref:Uncharacterized protein n=1 Tax=Deinococcus cellulosilyticus (strain DSM 18568 / NBRC 106333 / KACC 11606 / 5516J-15) TaxID=1223518 RepID=A0A511N797_DEIC1|nr:hypothetical protein DC3_43490 [Deinococcus cellulosilyticus NBRC 106333 = KACC 11606]